MFTEGVTCGQSGCVRSFSGRTATFRKHLNDHRYDVDKDPPVQAPLPGNNELVNLQDDDDVDEVLDMPRPENVAQLPQEAWNNLIAGEVVERAAMLVASLLAASSTVHTTVSQVVEHTAELVDDLSSFVKQRIKQFAHAVGLQQDDSFQNLIADTDEISHIFKNLETQYKQQKFVQNCEGFIPAEELPIGMAYYPRNNPVTGNV